MYVREATISFYAGQSNANTNNSSSFNPFGVTGESTALCVCDLCMHLVSQENACTLLHGKVNQQTAGTCLMVTELGPRREVVGTRNGCTTSTTDRNSQHRTGKLRNETGIRLRTGCTETEENRSAGPMVVRTAGCRRLRKGAQSHLLPISAIRLSGGTMYSTQVRGQPGVIRNLSLVRERWTRWGMRCCC